MFFRPMKGMNEGERLAYWIGAVCWGTVSLLAGLLLPLAITWTW
jgi:hypothetical protein